MTHLPSFDPSQVVTKSDLAVLRTDIDKLSDHVDKRLVGIDRRLDRLFLTLLAGMFVIVATMASVIFTVG